MQKPGFWRVLVAYLIDWGMLPICFYILHTSYPFWMSGDGVGDSMTLLLGPFGLFALYFVICKFVFGKTLGKKLMGLQVVQDTPKQKGE